MSPRVGQSGGPFVARRFRGLALALALAPAAGAAEGRSFEVKAPEGELVVRVAVGERLSWSVTKGGRTVIAPSPISLRLGDGSVLGQGARVSSHRLREVDRSFDAINYVKAVVHDRCRELTLRFRGDYDVVFRAYDDGVAYRFVTRRPGELVVADEEANFNFTGDHPAFLPYLWDFRGGEIFNASFESLYTESRLSEFKKDAVAFLPLVVAVDDRRRVEILEADLEDYPGMYLVPGAAAHSLRARFAAYPLETRRGGFQEMNVIPTKRAGYIAKTKGTRSFPWRVALVVDEDKSLLANDVIQRLASPPRIQDVSWIVPGLVSWDWWSDFDLTGVDFIAGMNTKTFLHHVDFAAENRAKYIILDAGWSDTFDLLKVNPEVDLDAILHRAKEKGIGVVLWAAWYTVTQQMDVVFPKYAAMGVKGWKIDFVDRDDQLAVASTYAIAEAAAKHRMLVDYHGIFKPTGLQRTWPNVIGYEGVYGLENFKWADHDAPRYAVTIPFIRSVAGPMDYTPGAMGNVTQADFKARNHAPMAKGTRAHHVAQYVIFDVPFQMLADSPSAYRREPESTNFITRIPTTFDESRPLDGKIAEYVVLARRKGSTWYVGAMTNWTARDLEIDLSFLAPGAYEATLLADGKNAHRQAMDYKKTVMPLSGGEKLRVHLAPGGGWAAIIAKK